ncbi:secreted RxLR effector protein 161-like [Capsicum annuum]|uniref:secreted RxLR effector protein 161-like n=1 Tax=Capsicum annuum TaxID=4072 RepID=UPI001FB13A93|nr:secreted RxLR effector protein 161-like [Capsicum annuum]
MKYYKPGDVPMVKGDKLSLDLCSKNDLEKDFIKDVSYPSSVGSLIYAQVCTCLDIAFIVNALESYQTNPGRIHWVASKKVMRYLKKTRDYMLMYKRVDDLEVIGYTDSDFAGCPDDLRSTSGFIFMFVWGEISWKSVKQTLKASFTMQAEFVACYDAATQAI